MKSFLFPKLRRDFALAQERNRRFPTKAAAAAQWEALRTVWTDCVADVPYYRGLVACGRAPRTLTSWEDFRALPILTRKVLQDHPQEFIRASGPPEGFTKTAGSTGTPLRIGVSQREKDLMRVVKLAVWQQFGYTPSSRLFLIWGDSHLLSSGWQGRVSHLRRKAADALLGYHRVDAYRLTPLLCKKHAKALIRFRPLGLVGYASALDLFVRHTTEFQHLFGELGLRFVLATSEMPPKEDTFDLLARTFRCPVIQEYGGAEFGQVAINFGKDRFDVFGDLNYVDALPSEDGSVGACPIAITSLYRRYVPLIRYSVGDALVEPCFSDNHHVASFRRLAGRINDIIRMPDGAYVHSVAIFHCIHQELAVHNIQMVLRDTGIEVRLAASQGTLPDHVLTAIRSRLLQVHPALPLCALTVVPDVQTNRAGKRRWFIDERSNLQPDPRVH